MVCKNMFKESKMDIVPWLLTQEDAPVFSISKVYFHPKIVIVHFHYLATKPKIDCREVRRFLLRVQILKDLKSSRNSFETLPYFSCPINCDSMKFSMGFLCSVRESVKIISHIYACTPIFLKKLWLKFLRKLGTLHCI